MTAQDRYSFAILPFFSQGRQNECFRILILRIFIIKILFKVKYIHINVDVQEIQNQLRGSLQYLMYKPQLQSRI